MKSQTTADADPPRYEIRSVHDFARIPEDRRAVCLKEFEIWIGMVEATQKVMHDIPVRIPEAFVWIDDGKHEATIGISAKGQHIHVASGVMRGFSGSAKSV
jgi:hypothetical protein